MSYAIVGFGEIGQALAHAFARKNINVTVASRRPPEALAPQARGLDPRSSPSRCGMHSRPTQSSWRSHSGNVARLRRPWRAGKARRLSTR
jgi:predicted dinucleotide-binding enzyme